MSHSRTAVAPGVAVRMNDSHLVEELLICTAALTRLAFADVVVSRARHPQSLAKFSDREVLPHRINQRIPLCGSSESMLIAFFTRYELDRERRSAIAAKGK
jgi:hypothetical protein